MNTTNLAPAIVVGDLNDPNPTPNEAKTNLATLL